MTRISYRMADGKVVEIDVPDDVAEVTVDFEREERNAARRDRWRKEKSIEAMNEFGAEIADECADVEAAMEVKEKAADVMDAVSKLTAKQHELVRLVYFEEAQLSEIADREGVSVSAISQRLATIHKKLKKLLEKT